MITRQTSAEENRRGTCKARQNVKTVLAEFSGAFTVFLKYFGGFTVFVNPLRPPPYLTWLACENLRDLVPAGATDVLPSVRRSYQISLTWLWSTRARVTDSDQTVQRGIRTSAVLTFGLRVSRLNHSAKRSLKKQDIEKARDQIVFCPKITIQRTPGFQRSPLHREGIYC